MLSRRLGLGRLSALETKPDIVRYEREKPGELIHIDIKKLGRIDGIGHRITGDRTRQSNKRGTGWEYLHVAIDDACRLAYSEALANEKADSAVAFIRRALAEFEGDLIRERTMAGLIAARARGRKAGAASNSPRIRSAWRNQPWLLAKRT